MQRGMPDTEWNCDLDELHMSVIGHLETGDLYNLRFTSMIVDITAAYDHDRAFVARLRQNKFLNFQMENCDLWFLFVNDGSSDVTQSVLDVLSAQRLDQIVSLS